MLKGIPEIITPNLLYALDAMGHGDSVVLADANFPAYRLAGDHTLVHLPGIKMPELLAAVLDLIPVDHIKDAPGYVMQIARPDVERGLKAPIWETFRKIIAEKTEQDGLGQVERDEFYRIAGESELIVLTGERALYANVLLYKGVL